MCRLGRCSGGGPGTRRPGETEGAPGVGNRPRARVPPHSLTQILLSEPGTCGLPTRPGLRDTGGPGHACLYPGNSELCDAPSPRWGPRHGSRSGATLSRCSSTGPGRPVAGLGKGEDRACGREQPAHSHQWSETRVSAPVRPPPPGLRLSTVRGQGMRGQGDFSTRLGHAHSPPRAWVDTCIQVSGRGVLSWRPELSARCPHTVGLRLGEEGTA